MERHTAHSFCRIVTFVFLLYFAKVSGESILDVMKRDVELSKLQNFFTESTIIKTCSDVNYPEGNGTSDTMSPNSFLCLAFYDTCYKISHSSTFKAPFDDAATFDAYLEKFFLKEKEKEKFCKNIKGINVSYTKLEPFLSQLVHFGIPYVCYTVCFNMNGDFNQLCAIIAWRESIDNDTKLALTFGNTNLHDNPLKEKLNNESKSKTPIEVSRSDLTTEKTMSSESDSKKAKVNAMNNDNQKMENPQNKLRNVIIKPSESMAESSPLSTSNAKSTSLISQSNIGDNEDQKPKSKDVSPVLDAKVKIVPNSETARIPEKSDDEFGDINLGISNNKAEGSAKDINDDIKTSTISENTQDHENSANEGWNHGEDEKLSNGNNL